MKLHELLAQERDHAERTYTGLYIITPRNGVLHADYGALEDYKVSSRTGTGVFLTPNDYDKPVENLDSAEWVAKEYGRAHRCDKGNWTIIAKPGSPERRHQYE